MCIVNAACISCLNVLITYFCVGFVSKVDRGLIYNQQTDGYRHSYVVWVGDKEQENRGKETDGDSTPPGTLLRVHQGADYTDTDRPPPGTLLGVHQGTDYTEKDKLPVGPFSGYTRGQTTQKQTSLPLGPFSCRVHQETDYRENIWFDHREKMIFFWAIKCTAFPTSRFLPQNISINFNVFSVGGMSRMLILVLFL